MNSLRAAALAVVAIVVVAVVGYIGFGVVLVAFDQSTYTASTSADYDYDVVLANAEDAGYAVERVDSTGFHPEGIDALEAELGPGYEVVRAIYYHESGMELWANVFAGDGITELVVFSGEQGPVDPDTLPEAWLVDRITLLLGVDEATAERYVAEMRAAVTDDDITLAETDASERLQVEAVYADLESTGETDVRTRANGQGGVTYHYVVEGEPVGELYFVVERATITDREGRYTYVLNVDRVDGIGVTVEGPPGAERSEAELREAIRERFVTLGIPAGAADDLTFSYDGSVW